MSGERFLGSFAAEWQGGFYAQLAVVCEAAGLTVTEAQAVNCACRNLSLCQAGRMVGMDGSPSQLKGAMWHNLRRASEKLERFVYSRQPRRAPERRPSSSSDLFLWHVLSVMRTTDCKPRPVTYDALGREVTARGRLVIPDDLKREVRPHPDWLDDLCATVRLRLEEEGREAVPGGS